ncbi:uncharacterized protein LOC129776752 [Toxorhynchites rutilus septentrionalis]|uniref:uncharacterized protein LOC129776752 n=1 Tax=Toxorhynchites rutilus septentrionalis TaxID=329112 RepID=UPI002478F9D7|nr:uncharacterized protein LOC129776752 [Toxorhynchites rutilus septentrionalis]
MDKATARDKRRQDKHHKQPLSDKQKAKIQNATKKNKSLAATVPYLPKLESFYDDSFTKRAIEPNWTSSRDLPASESDSEDDQLNAADFEKLLQMPPTSGGHFVLSTEKHWMNQEGDPSLNTENITQRYGKYFRIDTKELNMCLSTIPLYERNGYSREIFSKQEIDSMDLKAHYASKKYEENLTKLKNKRSQLESKSLVDKIQVDDKPITRTQQEEVIAPAMQLVSSLIDSLTLTAEPSNGESPAVDINIHKTIIEDTVKIESLEQDIVPIGCDKGIIKSSSNVPSNSPYEESTPKCAPESQEDIQRWLDDILDM